MPDTTATDPGLLRPIDVASMLGVSVGTVDRLVADGALPVVRLRPGPNAGRRFRLGDVTRLIEQRTTRRGDNE